MSVWLSFIFPYFRVTKTHTERKREGKIDTERQRKLLRKRQKDGNVDRQREKNKDKKIKIKGIDRDRAKCSKKCRETTTDKEK